MRPDRSTDFVSSSANCDWIIEKAKELKALLSCESEAMVAANGVRALSDINTMMDALDELRKVVERAVNIENYLSENDVSDRQETPIFKTMEEALFAAAETLDWSCVEERYANGRYIRFEQYSPAGEDFCFSVPDADLVSAVRDYAYYFDIDDHVSMWLEARGNGDLHVPGAVALVEDAKEIQRMLDDLVIALEDAQEAFRRQIQSLSLNNKISDARALANRNLRPNRDRGEEPAR